MTVLDHSTILITGASSGIGRATAHVLARPERTLLLSGRNVAALEAVAESCRQAGAAVIPVLGDLVTETGQLVMEQAIQKFHPNIAIINAGMGHSGPFADSRVEDWTPVIDLNFTVAIRTTHSVLQSLPLGKPASLVLVSSVLGKRAVPYNAVYCATKYALHGFADSLRIELRNGNIHVGVVAPARTDTAFFERIQGDQSMGLASPVPTYSPDSVARDILHCIRHARREVICTPGGKLLSFLGQHFPRSTDAIFSLYYDRRNRA